MRYAVIDQEFVVNVIECDDIAWLAEHYPGSIQTDVAGPGWSYIDGAFSRPVNGENP